LRPGLKPLPSYDAAPALANVFMIGDRALEFLRAPHAHEILDLGAAWYELTGLPFVYAVWALRRVPNAPLRRQLRQAKDFGMDTLDYIISSRTDFDYNFRKDYLSWHIHYHLGSDERRGIAKFVELLRKHALGPVHDPHYVA
jgi:chorismate dehydratase